MKRGIDISPKRTPLDDFFDGIRASCNEHAVRKGYTTRGAGDGDVAGPLMDTLGVTQAHAIGEIALKLLEFQRAPRRVVAEKIAGWAWRLWCSCGSE
jgi:hypothetical protein